MKIIKYLFMFLLISQFTLAQFQQIITPTNQDLYDIVFIDENLGLTVGDSGTILRSSDGGLNWDQVFFSDSIQLRKVKFFNPQQAIALGTHLMTSTDGGLSWSIQNLSNDKFYDIEILNGSTCIISGYPIAIMKSFDYGLNWTTLVAENPNEEFGFLSFITENTGFTCRGSQSGPIIKIKKTIDGGLNWTTIEIQSGIGNTVIEDLHFTSENTGFKCGWYESHLTKTNDAGINWQYPNFTDSTLFAQLRDFHIEQNQPGSYYACGWYGTVIKSTDEGNSWTEVNTGLSMENEIFNGIYFADENTGWVAGSNGIICKTTNGGGPVGISELNNTSNLNLFPNPADETLFIGNPDRLTIKMVKLMNNSGQVVLETKWNEKLHLGNIPSGSYLVLIKTSEGNITKKIIID